MADYEAPSGPPPPKVPEGWVVRWNEQYKEWFYVNTFTKKSQWDKPTAPARRPGDDGPDGPPPSYTPSGTTPAPSDAKKNNPFNDHVHDKAAPLSKQAQEEEDARLARQLQDEEDEEARARSPASGAAASYPGTSLPPGSSGGGFPEDLPERDADGKRGILGKLFGKKPASQQQYPGAGGYGAGGAYGQQPPFGSQHYYGGGPQPGGAYGGYGPPAGPPSGYYGPPGGYYGGGPGPGGYAQQQQQQQGGRFGKTGGLGTMGGLALGAGGGLLGGMLIEDMIQNHDQSMYQQGFDQGEMADGRGDYGGGGGDFGDGGGGGDFGDGGGGF